MKPSSALETLQGLRQRAQEREQARLAALGQAEKEAEAEEERAQRALRECQQAAHRTRDAEKQRLESRGIRAAEGQWRMWWESAQRRAEQQLAARLERAVASRQEAARQHDLARAAVQRARAELEEVERQLQRRARAARDKLEQARQEALDEASSRRFWERNEA